MAKRRSRSPDTRAVWDHPTADGSNRFEVDEALRRAGFVIFSRHKGSEPFWLKAGKLFRQSAALEQLGEEELYTAEYLEFLYAEGYDR
jgi:hypothetical protein